jgi:cardiolipin synthase (CMP-forming)
MTIPNFITLVRLALVPVMGYFLVIGEYAIALVVFLGAALSDLLDGFIARTFHSTSRLGATLDPIADKLNMFVATVLLAIAKLIPLWLAVAIITRDVIIVAGALAYRAVLGHVEMKPTFLSKLNTFIEFGVLLLVMATAAGWFSIGAWLPVVFTIVFATVIASGMQYVWVWGRKAVQESRR